MLVWVQAPRWMVHQRLVFASSFSGSGASNLKPPTMGIAAGLSPIAMTILLCRWQMMARLKARDPRHRFGWSADDWADNNVADMAILLAH